MWLQPLQPGEVEPREFVFDVPGVIQQPGLLIAEGGWPSLLIIGDDNSFFHKVDKSTLRFVRPLLVY